MTTPFLRFAAVLLGAAILSGCAARQAFDDGRLLIDKGAYTQGFRKVEEAVAADPNNVEYRIYYASQRLSVLNSILARADSARGLGKAEDAEALYVQALVIDPANQVARSGLDKLASEKRQQRMVEQADAQFRQGSVREAEEVVRAVMAENPNHRDANALRTRIAEKKVAERRPDTKLSDAFRKPVSLDFRDAQLRSVFDVLSRSSGINFVFDKDVKTDLKININAKNTTVDDALKLMLLTNQLDQRVLNENTVLIYPNTPQKAKDYQTLMVRSFYLANADVKQVSNTLKTILKTRDVVVNEKLNLLIIRDTADAVRMAERLIALEDIGESEVMLEVEVMEIKRSRLMELGLRWPDQYQFTVQQALGASPFTLLDLTGITSARRDQILGSIDVRAQASSNYILNLKKEDGDTNLLANPRIRVRNKEKAKIMIGDRVPVITTTSTSTGFVADSVSYVDVGLKLDVEPNVYLDDEVSIKISLEVSSIAREVTTRSGSLSYQIGTRNASTVLKLRDGETQVLAGLITDEDRSTANRVPGLGQFPILGRLFTSQRDDKQKTEIVLSITPRLIRTVKRPDLMVAEFESGTESSIGGRGLAIGAATADDRTRDAAPRGAGQAPPRAGSPPQPPSPAQQPSNFPPVAPFGTPQSPPPSALPPSEAQPPPPVASFSVFWAGPAQVRAGETFAMALQVQSQEGITALPFLVGFDPAVLQPVAVVEGDFMKRDGGQSDFSSQISAQEGRIAVTGLRRGEAGAGGAGAAAIFNFRSLRSVPETRVQLLAITPNPDPREPLSYLPLQHRIAVTEN